MTEHRKQATPNGIRALPTHRPPTPDPVARQLRREAGFGCCVCGNPILQYHHIVEWAVEHHFRPADMMALCPNHHDQATKGAMTESEQRDFKARPRNIRDGFARGRLAVKQDYCAADFGSVTVVGTGAFLRIGEDDLLGFHLGEGNLEVSLRLYNEADELLLHIHRNEWVSGDPLPWDIEADWQTLTLRERARHISVSLNAKVAPIEVRAELWRHGKRITLGRDGIRVAGKTNVGFSELALVGMLLELHLSADGFTLGPHATHPNGFMVSWPSRKERLWKAKEAWKKIEAAKLR